MFGGKYMEFCVIFSLQYSISINTFEVDPPSDSPHNAIVKPKNKWMFLMEGSPPEKSAAPQSD
jgi:hypothetical protein